MAKTPHPAAASPAKASRPAAAPAATPAIRPGAKKPVATSQQQEVSPRRVGAPVVVRKRKKAEHRERATDDRTTVKVKVRATEMGYYRHIRRREGDVFSMKLPIEADGSIIMPSWCDEANPNEPVRITTGTQELKARHDETLLAKMQLGARRAEEDDDDEPKSSAVDPDEDEAI